MRRGFNKSLLPKEAPKKGERVRTSKRKPLQKCAMMQELLLNYREQMGESYSDESFARALHVKEKTVRRYFMGYLPHLSSYWNIARYFAPYTSCTAQILHHDMSETYKDFKAQQ